jgi:hypothetical protein
MGPDKRHYRNVGQATRSGPPLPIPFVQFVGSLYKWTFGVSTARTTPNAVFLAPGFLPTCNDAK